MEYITLSPSVLNLYAELLQQARSAEAIRSLADLKGVFVSKKIKDRNYWYLQHNLSGKQTQIYLGAENKELLRFIQKHREGKKSIAPDLNQRKKLCSMIVQGGGFVPDVLSSRVLMLLSESGVFKMGSVLVGTHAFHTYALLLGVSWKQKHRTQDIDVAQAKNISVALSLENVQTDLPTVLDQAQLGFFPIPKLSHKHASTSFKIQGKELHLDLLTPLLGKESFTPLYLPALKTSAHPLRFLDYLIEDPVDAVIPYDAGILVNIPQPARFAFHKLLISSKRSITDQVKSKKDFDQSISLLKILLEDRPGDLLLAWDELKKRGKNWTAPILKKMGSLKKMEKSFVEKLRKELGDFK